MTRKLLSYAQNADEIQYISGSSTATSRPAVKPHPLLSQGPSASSKTAETTPPAPAETQINTAPAPVAKVAMVADAPVQAKDIVIAIIAQKLRKSHAEVATDKTIKLLVSGIVLPLTLPLYSLQLLMTQI